MNAESLSDRELVEALRDDPPVGGELVDEYYRRCIPIYLDFIGVHWHTGFYLDQAGDIGPTDQVRMIHHIADTIDIGPGQRVLDVGCGIGGTPACLARDYGVEAVGLTPVEDQRRTSAAVIQRLGMSGRVVIDLGHAGALPYPDASFDAVMFLESPCHFPDRRAFFDEAMRVLKPGGRLAGEDWLATGTDGRCLDPIRRSWAIPSLGTGDEYLEHMACAAP
ncbi:MAG TPA: methyltransferase domain-containing protein [Arenicellales bacterium]|nr:methyltransferase domain-containing protein [Arenicellales bacterium]